MNIFQSLILGAVEGISEFLPISSTGHLILASKLMGLSGEFSKSFDIAIQSGAILAVLLLYGKYLLSNRELLKKTIVGFIPTGIIGLALYKYIKMYLIGNYNITLLSLLVGGIVLIFVELYFRKQHSSSRRSDKSHFSARHSGLDPESIEKQKGTEQKSWKNLTYKNALLIGLIQSVSIIPGVSRSAATIIGGLFLGLDRKAAVEFSFLLAIPTLLSATGYDLLKNYKTFSSSEFGILAVGFITSGVVAFFVIRWLLDYIKRYTFINFGIYRILLAMAFFFLLK